MAFAVAALKNREAEKKLRRLYETCLREKHPSSPEKCRAEALVWANNETDPYMQRAAKKLFGIFPAKDEPKGPTG